MALYPLLGNSVMFKITFYSNAPAICLPASQGDFGSLNESAGEVERERGRGGDGGGEGVLW